MNMGYLMQQIEIVKISSNPQMELKRWLKIVNLLLLTISLLSVIIVVPTNAETILAYQDCSIIMNCRYENYSTGMADWTLGTGSYSETVNVRLGKEDYNTFNDEAVRQYAVENYGSYFNNHYGADNPLYLVSSRIKVTHTASTEGGFHHYYYVYLYWAKRYNVSYVYNGNPSGSTTALGGETVSVRSAPTGQGYTFSGWTTSTAVVSNGTFVVPANDVVFYGTGGPRTDTPYSVKFYLQNPDGSYTEQTSDTINGKGTTDTRIFDALDYSTVLSLVNKYPHAHLTDTSKTDLTVIGGNGTSVLKLYYDMDSANVSYVYSGSVPKNAPAVPAATAQKYGATVAVAAVPTLSGYDFSGWTSGNTSIYSGMFTMLDQDVTISGDWTPCTDTPCTVEYYQQNINNGDYTLAYTFNGEGITGSNVPHKEFTGFTEVPDSVTSEGSFKIKSDGTGILKLYFDRAICTVTYTYTGETDATPPALPETANYHYGQTVSVDAGVPVLPGYDFSGWRSVDVEVTDGQFLMPDKPVTFTGTWKAQSDVPYTVEFYQQNMEDDGYTLADTFAGEGTAGGNIPLKEFEGFLLTPDSVTAAGSFKIKSDGTATLKLYYDRERFTVTYAYAGRSAGDTVPEDAPELPATVSYRNGRTVTLPAQPQSKSAQRFLGWALDGTLINLLNFALEKDVVITGY